MVSSFLVILSQLPKINGDDVSDFLWVDQNLGVKCCKDKNLHRYVNLWENVVQSYPHDL
jgi:hypothetical protein